LLALLADAGATVEIYTRHNGRFTGRIAVEAGGEGDARAAVAAAYGEQCDSWLIVTNAERAVALRREQVVGIGWSLGEMPMPAVENPAAKSPQRM
jgi:hypothetical protein